MGKNIVVCSDGTGNRGGKAAGTNVWRIFNAVERHNQHYPQVTYYDDGVGTDDLRWLRLIGGAFGWGLSRNIRQAYTFLSLNYEPGDRIYLFGFSRGAFTVRSLAGMVLDVGLLKRDALLGAGNNRDRMLRKLLRAHRSRRPTKDARLCKRTARDCRLFKAKKLGEFCKSDLQLPPEEKNTGDDGKSLSIHFIGVWDTVDAVGVPFDGLKAPIECISRLMFRLRAWQFADCELSKHVKHACQALSLDDERKTFLPNIWKTERESSGVANDCFCDDRIEQVWFAGAHSNVGGGYPKDALAHVTLDWMMQKAASHGLAFAQGELERVQTTADAHGKIYNSRSGLGAIYRYKQRNPYCETTCDPKTTRLPRVHVSVIRRLLRRTDLYASRVLHSIPPPESGESRGKARGGSRPPPVRCRVVGTRNGPFALRKDEDFDDVPAQ